jgi:glycosyltransferase involved in cell wall biosynthesis
MLERAVLVDVMKCADLFVQPGAPGPFNDYRLPSKLPEFMAVGRPLILPATNLGLRLADGEEVLLLRTGSADEIAAAIERLLDDPALALRLSANAQAFARRAWRWDRQGRRLLDFLQRLTLPAR